MLAQPIAIDVSESVADGVRWLGYSGIQTPSGAVADFYHVENRVYSETSTLSSAYLLDALLKLVEMEDEVPDFVTVTAEYLMNQKRDEETQFFVSSDPIGDYGPLASLFDCGVVMQALAGLSELSRNYEFVTAAERCGTAFLTRMSRVDGSFFPVYDLASKEALEITGDWKTEAGVHLLKSANAARFVHDLTGNGDLRDIAGFMVRWAVRDHEGFLDVDEPAAKMTERMHGYCCFLDGLLPTASRDLMVMQTLQGGFLDVEERTAALASTYERCEVTAQMLRLRLFCDLMGIVELDQTAAEQEAESLLSFQIYSDDPAANGGFSPAKIDGVRVPIVATRATAYASQALEMWSDQADCAFSGDWKDLI